MPILFRYLFALFFSGFTQILGVFFGLFFLLDGAEQIRKFGGREHVVWQDLTELLVLRMPAFLAQFMPAIALLATLVVVSRLSRNNELTVMRAGGVSLLRILIPFLFGGAIVAAAQAGLQDQITPRANQAAEALEARLNQTASTQQLRKGGELWLRDQGRIIHARRILFNEHAMEGVTVFEFDPDHRLVRRINAVRAQQTEQGWRLLDGIVYDLQPDGDGAQPFTSLPWEVELETRQLDRSAPRPDELSIGELWEQAERLQREGYEDTPYRMALYRKIADPFATLSAILLAFPFALRLSRMGGAARSGLAGLLAGFALFVVVDLFTALGLGERLPTLFAAWAPVASFASIGVFLLMHIEETAPR
ncbi:LPS export ABC transporter permease LptG [Magnetofaba australis]|uniref:Putative YjgP/YjgQ family permease n=1 Tax=Magnetofaba australis IT-1 TaxID=1434232 RepID=A0A1Y2K647_9PROT|nr:LPS export ABC transporter permease LptG [Magnetofaba australis]OSM02584.1 putative YjgP/YjgQ family permease [Magnetofaba australis IT-1]